MKYQDKTLDLKLMAVRAKTRREGSDLGTQSGPYTLVGPGLYQGLVQKRGKYDSLAKSLSIYIWRQCEDGKWVEGVKKKKGRSTEVFIHPAYIPDWLDGCLALGYTPSDYGFESADDSTKAMKNVFELLGISTDADFKKAEELVWNKKIRVIVTMTDKRPASTDTVTLRVRIPIDPADSKSADDTFELTSTDGSYKNTLTVKDDSKPGDTFVDLIYDGIDRGLSYTLEINPGAGAESYFIFQNTPYSDILQMKRGS